MTLATAPIFGFPNFADSTFVGSGQIAPVIGGGDWQTTRPLTRLLEEELIRAGRSTDATLANTKFDIDLGTLRDIGVVAIPKHNISRDGQVRFKQVIQLHGLVLLLMVLMPSMQRH